MDAPSNSIFSGPITDLLSHASAKKKEKKTQGFQISHFYWSFSNDIVAVKWLNPLFLSGQPRVPTQHHPRVGDETARDPHQRGQESEVSASFSAGK